MSSPSTPPSTSSSSVSAPLVLPVASHDKRALPSAAALFADDGFHHAKTSQFHPTLSTPTSSPSPSSFTKLTDNSLALHNTALPPAPAQYQSSAYLPRDPPAFTSHLIYPSTNHPQSPAKNTLLVTLPQVYDSRHKKESVAESANQSANDKQREVQNSSNDSNGSSGSSSTSPPYQMKSPVYTTSEGSASSRSHSYEPTSSQGSDAQRDSNSSNDARTNSNSDGSADSGSNDGSAASKSVERNNNSSDGHSASNDSNSAGSHDHSGNTSGSDVEKELRAVPIAQHSLQQNNSPNAPEAESDSNASESESEIERQKKKLEDDERWAKMTSPIPAASDDSDPANSMLVQRVRDLKAQLHHDADDSPVSGASSHHSSAGSISPYLHLSAMLRPTPQHAQPLLSSESPDFFMSLTTALTPLTVIPPLSAPPHTIPSPYYLQYQVFLQSEMRPVLIDWLYHVGQDFHVPRRIIQLTINSIDRFLTKQAEQIAQYNAATQQLNESNKDNTSESSQSDIEQTASTTEAVTDNASPPQSSADHKGSSNVPQKPEILPPTLINRATVQLLAVSCLHLALHSTDFPAAPSINQSTHALPTLADLSATTAGACSVTDIEKMSAHVQSVIGDKCDGFITPVEWVHIFTQMAIQECYSTHYQHHKTFKFPTTAQDDKSSNDSSPMLTPHPNTQKSSHPHSHPHSHSHSHPHPPPISTSTHSHRHTNNPTSSRNPRRPAPPSHIQRQNTDSSSASDDMSNEPHPLIDSEQQFQSTICSLLYEHTYQQVCQLIDIAQFDIRSLHFLPSQLAMSALLILHLASAPRVHFLLSSSGYTFQSLLSCMQFMQQFIGLPILSVPESSPKSQADTTYTSSLQQHHSAALRFYTHVSLTDSVLMSISQPSATSKFNSSLNGLMNAFGNLRMKNTPSTRIRGVRPARKNPQPNFQSRTLPPHAHARPAGTLPSAPVSSSDSSGADDECQSASSSSNSQSSGSPQYDAQPEQHEQTEQTQT